MIRAKTSRTDKKSARPFLKWAGGKRQLLAQFAAYYPPELASGEITRYVEPFVGGGAVFLDVVQRFPIREVFLFDINRELILAYQIVQQKPQTLIELLSEHRNAYLRLDESERRIYFYRIRDAYNQQRGEFDYRHFSDAWVERTAYMLFLNKTCYNGLFRVNSQGRFNVPYGRYRRPAILNEDNLLRVSGLLQKATLGVGRFDACRAYVNDESFVYFDPPYRPISTTANFTAYSSNGFSENDQIALSVFYAELDENTNARLMLSNSDPTELAPDDDFFKIHYDTFHFGRVHASRMINTDAGKRGKIPELVITNY